MLRGRCIRGTCAFLSTPSARRATCFAVAAFAVLAHFYPRPPRGGRLTGVVYSVVSAQFLSTPSARRATTSKSGTSGSGMNFYPRPPRGGRQFLFNFFVYYVAISIHALREEGDRRGQAPGEEQEISIHALREEGDVRFYGVPTERVVFLSTPSARRATCVSTGYRPKEWYFYPRPPRGGRLARSQRA